MEIKPLLEEKGNVKMIRRRYYLEGYRDGISDSVGLAYSPPLRRGNQQRYDTGKEHGKQDREDILNNRYMLSKLEI